MAELLDHAELPEGTVLITNHQTQGRGQRGNSWESGRGENLTFSLLLRPGFLSPLNQFQLSIAVSLGIADALSRYVPAGIRVKWPNDIMIKDKKAGGVLIENQTQGQHVAASIIGIGINVNQPDMQHPGAGSLIGFMGKPIDLNELLHELLACLEVRYLELRTGGHDAMHGEYLSRLYGYNLPQAFESAGKSFTGTIKDVDESGRLCVQVGSEIRQFALKEIKMLIGR